MEKYSLLPRSSDISEEERDAQDESPSSSPLTEADEQDITRRSSWELTDLSSRAPALDGLRGIAILFSMYDHFGFPSNGLVGHFGVSIFFVLSGFLISGILAQQARKVDGKSRYHYLGHFYAARFARLLPGQLLVTIVGGLHLYYISPKKYEVETLVRSALRVLTSTEDAKGPQPHTPYGNAWSLAVEEWSYVFLSLAMPFLPARYGPRLRAIMIPITLLLCLKLWSVLSPQTFWWSWQGKFWLGFPPFNFDWHFGTPPNMWKIGVGAAARLLPWPRWMHRNKILAILLAPTIVGIVIGHGYLFSAQTKGGFRSILIDPLVSILTAMTILSSLDGNPVLEIPILRFFGRVSYSWYLWQWPLVDGYKWPTQMSRVGLTAEALGIAYFSTVYIEEPILRIFRRRRDRKSHLPITMSQVNRATVSLPS